MALAVDFALVVLGGEVESHRKFRLALQDLCLVRRGRDCVPHLRERSGEKGMMRVVRPCDPRESLGGFGVFLGAVAGATEVAPEALRVWYGLRRIAFLIQSAPARLEARPAALQRDRSWG